DRHYIAPLAHVLERAAGSADAAAEVQQRLRVQLLLGSDGKLPQIATYRGQGSLRGWLRVVATREAVRQARDEAHNRGDDEQLLREVASAANTELEYVRKVYNREVVTALRKALATLDAQKQNVLRHHYIDRLGIDEIGRIHHVHRATAARWLETAKAELVRRARRALEAQLHLGADGLTSVVRLMQSQL